MDDSTLHPADVEVSFYPPRPIGGQQVGTTTSGILLKHLPTGLSVICESERSQYKNKQKALEYLEIIVMLEVDGCE